MIKDDLFRGKLVRLAVEDPKTMAGPFSRWARDSEYWRLLSSDPPMLFSVRTVEKWLEKDTEHDSIIIFIIRTLEDDRIIGEISLDGIRWSHGDTFLGISIGNREDWNKGYGTDAMRIILRYAFTELNLHRVSLNVFEYNQRAIRSYEKAGFRLEGNARESLVRDGQRWDMIFMGILCDDWQLENV